MTSFVGRRREVAEIRSLLAKSRLVTLTGVGGVGKTRLAARVAAEVGRAFPDGVWLAELATLDRPDLLAQTLTDVLRLREGSGGSNLDRLADHLADKKALLILDNCEHVLHECAVLTEELLACAPELRVIATSRQPLHIGGERTMAVLPLPLPEAGGRPLSVDALAQVDAVRLFAERAEAVLPEFAVTEANRDAVERICRRLDGIPLAIELAAVRLRALSVRQLLERLDDRFRLLASGSRAVPPRHQTLRAMVDWSHELCTEPERLLWARASVFAGGLDLEAAEAVCSGGGIAREDVMDLVSGLVEKSVLLREEHPGEVRYRLLETIRQYGKDRLAESGAEEELRRRHRDYYRDLARQAHAHRFGGAQVEWLTRLRLDHANLRAALASYAEDGGPAEARDGLTMAADLLFHWRTCHHVREGRHWLDRGLALVPEPGEPRARALWSAAWLAIVQGDVAAAVAMLEESRRIGEELGLDGLLAYVTLQSGMVALHEGDTGVAAKMFEEALAGHRAAQEEVGQVMALNRLCLTCSFEGDSERAAAYGEEALQICDARGDHVHRAYALIALGVEAWRQGDCPRAAETVKQGLRVVGPLDDWLGVGLCLEVLAWIATGADAHERTARLLGALAAVWRAVGTPLPGFGHLGRYHDETEARARAALGEPAYRAAFAQGLRMSLEEALTYAVAEQACPATPGRAPERAPSPLTRRETEISGLVAEGLSNKEIAARLVIAQRTAEGHIEHILSKLGFHSRAQIAVWVAEQRRAHEGGGDGP
ncbi:ATP-binding protein [Sphaerisporangium krabiense]|uniref:Putative ATPase/DNA-binding CsgD family transcriptional regulator n=1 Tax=Sphaerisporangium krabiense TaxID=763782 RepID=A0A7W9DPK0_9ACTN|nr:LuxR C-terminal-related transcriptional regulator [Sphaerisporangium krabiense]MBB5625420.1 putative ATPase/DNA-binding CsgD family transcriptional regulator [Sphaerisporangium krabiense]